MKPFKLDENSIIIDDISNITQDFKNLLTIRDSLTYKNCNNIKIIIKSTINKFILKNIIDSEIIVEKTVSGIEIENCKNLKITISDDKPIYHLLIDESENININLNKNIFKNTKIDIIDSNKIIFEDYNNKIIFKI